MKKSRLILLIFIIAFTNQGCQSYFAEIFPEKATHEFDEYLVKASSEFQQGWRDGCETGMSAASNTFYKIFYRSNKVDGYKMSYSTDYKTAWNNSFWYCYRRDYVKQKSPIFKSVFSGFQ
ncbi:MAG: hypothetical protein SFV53_02895 [Rickettsiales bacterium]|nr:hypothetical protein [Rickettsiales bacterium]